MEDIAIHVNDVSKAFKLPHEKQTSIKSIFVSAFKGRKRTYEEQQVLKDVSFDIKKGEFFGIVGRNGSGKSTLLKLLAGIYAPDSGIISVHGKLTPFIELGVGFNPELTGRENVFLNGALLGFNRKEMEAMYDEIVGFAELERFMDQKLKNYSSGMQVRLAFSIAIRAKSDILLIDEVLAVGDAAFQSKCFDYFVQLKKQGTTVIFVSHDRGSLERFCDRGILIDEGQISDEGDIKGVLQSYNKIVLDELGDQNNDQEEEPQREVIRSAYLKIMNVRTADSSGSSKRKFKFGERIFITYEISIKRPVENPIIGLTIWQKNLDKAVYATNTLIDGNGPRSGKFLPGDHLTFETALPGNLNDGEYYVEPGIANESVTLFFEQKPKATTFLIAGSNNPHSLLSSEVKARLTKSKTP